MIGLWVFKTISIILNILIIKKLKALFVTNVDIDE